MARWYCEKKMQVSMGMAAILDRVLDPIYFTHGFCCAELESYCGWAIPSHDDSSQLLQSRSAFGKAPVPAAMIIVSHPSAAKSIRAGNGRNAN
jgi:hypothetical protein